MILMGSIVVLIDRTSGLVTTITGKYVSEYNMRTYKIEKCADVQMALYEMCKAMIGYIRELGRVNLPWWAR